jgi:outer membrane protein TolC
MTGRARITGAGAGLAVLAVTLATAWGQGAVKRVTLSVQDAVARAVTRSPEVTSSTYDVEAFLGKQMQADGARFPQISAVAFLGPSPAANRAPRRGEPEALNSINAKEGRVDGVFARTDFLLVQPLYTFGLISNLREAAARGVRAQQAAIYKTATEVALRVKEAYYGLVLARELRTHLGDLHEQLLKAADRTQTLVDGGFAAEQDLFKLRAFEGELEKNLNLTTRLEAIAQEALRVWTGLEPGSTVEPADAKLSADLRPVGPVDEFVREARDRRPEFIQLREGIKAKEALAEAERAKYWPMVFFGIQGSVAGATNRDGIRNNAYVDDPLSHAYAGPVLGLKYDLDFGITKGRVREAEAEVQKLVALQTLAHEGIPLQVQKAYGELREAEKNVAALDRANDYARKWVVSALANNDLGIGDTKDLADAVLAMAKSHADYLQAVFNYHMGLARLENAAGRDLDEIRGLLRGRNAPDKAEEIR